LRKKKKKTHFYNSFIINSPLQIPRICVIHDIEKENICTKGAVSVENLSATGVSLLDILRVYASCSYLSDLHDLSGPQRMRLARKLGKLLPEAYSLWQWNDALTYLADTLPEKTAAMARTRLLTWLSRPLTPDAVPLDDSEPEAAVV
jgi:hypothetical protein